jgi:hypothetical protein
MFRRRLPNDRERDLSPLERYIRQEDSRRAIARVRRYAAELAQQSVARHDAGLVRKLKITSPGMVLRRAATWLRHLMAPFRSGAPRS